MAVTNTTDTTVDARRWNAFVCQDCRGIFRVPVGHHGKGVVCPICDRMLRLAKAGESIPALVQSTEDTEPQQEVLRLQEMVEPEPETVAEITQAPSAPVTEEKITAVIAQNLPAPDRRGRKHRTMGDIEHEWQSQSPGRTVEPKRFTMFWIGLAAGTALVAIAFLVFSLMKKGDAPVTQIPSTKIEITEIAPAKKTPSVNASIIQEIPQIEKISQQYLEAKSPTEMLAFIRKAKGVEEKLQNYYKDRSFAALGYSRFDDENLIGADEENLFYAQVYTKDFEPKTLTIVRENGVFLIDWESTEGWGEMSYAELTKKKPTTPITVRVTLMSESYYNFDFPPSEEHLWESYRLIFADGSMLHGYVAKASELDNQLRLSPDEEQKNITIEIKYRVDSTSDKQVLIDRVVHDSWFIR